HERAASLLHRSAAAIGFAWDCFAPLIGGVPLVIAAAVDARDVSELARCVVEHGVSHVTGSPTLWNAVLDHAERHPSAWANLQLARSNGDHLRADTVDRWRRVLPGAGLLNLYGATECSSTTVFDTAQLPHSVSGRVPVGAPLSNVEVFI